MTGDPAGAFGADVLEAFRTAVEVDVETLNPEHGARRTIIWVVVANGAPYIRSYRGADARWYREIRQEPVAAIHVEERRVPVRAVLVEDPDSISAVSRELAAKYVDDTAMPAMLRSAVLGTTLRLEPA